jgi:hypothetical protein
MVTVKKAATHSMICSKTKARNVWWGNLIRTS